MASTSQWRYDSALQKYFWIDQTGRRVYEESQTTKRSALEPRAFASNSVALNPAASNTASFPSTGSQSPLPRPLDDTRSSYTYSRQQGSGTNPTLSSGYGSIPDTLTRDFGNVSLQPTSQDANTTPLLQGRQPASQASPLGTYRDLYGRMIVNFTDPRNGVQTVAQTGPARQIFTDPGLSRYGVTSHMHLFGTEGDEEQLFKNFRKRDKPRQFFTIGKVFRVLWSEPAGESNTDITMLEAGTSVTRFGELVYSKVRRFVVVREGDTYCSALPIMTYNRRGVSKPGTKKSEHSIIYTGKIVPEPLPEEAPQQRGERPMRPDAIRVNTDVPTEKLDAFSRIDYGKVYTIQHNIKVASFGQVHPNSMNALLHQFRNVWMDVEPSLPTAGDSVAAIPTKSTTSDTKDASGRDSTPATTAHSPRPRPTAGIGGPGGRQAAARTLIAGLVARGYSLEQAADYVLNQGGADQEVDDESSSESSAEEDTPSQTHHGSGPRNPQHRPTAATDLSSNQPLQDPRQRPAAAAITGSQPPRSGQVPQQKTAPAAESNKQPLRRAEVSQQRPMPVAARSNQTSRSAQPTLQQSEAYTRAYTRVTTIAQNSGQLPQTQNAIARLVQTGYPNERAYSYIADNLARFEAVRYDPAQALTMILSQLSTPPSG